MKRKNLFIAFEGIDGSGKSTQVELLTEKLSMSGHKVYSTFEPTNGPIGTMIRDIFNHRMEANHKTIAALFVADRFEHIVNTTNGILTKLDEGYTVITDRYYLSSYAYHAAYMPMDWVIQANALCAELLRPDITIYIDIAAEVSMKRLDNSRASKELYETLENLRTVHQNYLQAINLVKDKEHIYIIDGNKTTEQIAIQIWQVISKAYS